MRSSLGVIAVASTDDILLRLVIKGMDPGEVKALADKTYGQLKTEAARHIEELAALHRRKSEEMAADTKKEVDEKIKAETKALGALQQLMRQQEIDHNKAHNNWRRLMEDLENVTTVSRGVFDVMKSGFERFKSLAEQIDKTTNIYGSLKGSIDQMREASGGEISDMDLIITKNRAMNKELELTDEQFGTVAASADAFADSVGTGTKEALDSLVDGLAEGRTKMLHSIGVMVDSDRAYQEYSEKIGVAVNRLTDHEKKLAVVEASLRAMDKKLMESGGEIKTFSNEWEKTMAQVGNVWDSFLLRMGRGFQKLFHILSVDLPAALKAGPMYDPETGQLLNPDADKNFDAMSKAEDDKDAKAAADRAAAAAKRYGTPGSYDQKRDKASEDAQRKKQFAAQYAEAAKKAAAEAAQRQAFNRKLFNPGLDQNYRGEDNGAFPNLTEAGFSADGVGVGTPADVAEAQFRAMHPEYAAFRANNPGVSTQGTTLGEQTQNAGPDDALMKLLLGAGGGDKTLAGSTEDFLDQFDKDFAQPLMTKVAATQEQLKQTSEQAGFGGFAGLLLYGEDGPDVAYAEMDHFGQAINDLSAMVGSTAGAMTQAAGKSLAAAISGTSAQRQSIRQITHDTLASLAEQATVRALFEAAEGLASLALGPIGGVSAGAHFAAAAAFGAVGVSAGLGARAIGSGVAGPLSQQQQWQKEHDDSLAKKAYGDAHGWNTKDSGGLSSSSSGFGSGGQRSMGGGGGDRPSVVINLNNVIGGADTGRAVKNAIEAYQNLTGEQLLGQAA